MTCQRCGGSGWQCESHSDQPMDHSLSNGERCPAMGQPCDEPGCPHRGTPKGAWMSLSALDQELADLSRQVIDHFGRGEYSAAVVRAATIGKKTPNDPHAMNLALRDEFRRLLGPH